MLANEANVLLDEGSLRGAEASASSPEGISGSPEISARSPGASPGSPGQAAARGGNHTPVTHPSPFFFCCCKVNAKNRSKHFQNYQSAATKV